MPRAPVPAALDDFLRGPNLAVIASLNADGAPSSVATWYLWEQGRALVNMDEGRARLDNLRRDPRVSITILDRDDWYVHVSLRGRVVDLHDDQDFADIDRLARQYTGQPYRNHERGRVSAWIEVESWHGWQHGAPIKV